MSILPQHVRVVDQFLDDLRKSVEEVRQHPELAKEGLAGVYGMVSTIPDKSIIEDFLVKIFGEIFSVGNSVGIVEEFRSQIPNTLAATPKTEDAHVNISRQSSM